MKKLNTLLAALASTFILANAANAHTIEVVKAQPINHKDLQASISLQLQETITLSKSAITMNSLPLNIQLAKKQQPEASTTAAIVKVSYSAE
ncbi:MAG: hypothetical protein ACPG46_06840 [Thalassotalea sp.]